MKDSIQKKKSGFSDSLRRLVDQAVQFRGRRQNSLDKAIQWVKNHRIPSGGVLAHHRSRDVSQEVTGYLIDSLYRVGEKVLAVDLAKWEVFVQRADGGFVGPGTNVPYTFDTAQVVRGFLAVTADMPGIGGAVRKACDFIVKQIAASGEVRTPNADLWKLPDGSTLSAYCNLYVLPPLKEAGLRYGVEGYVDAVQRALNFYKQKADLTEFKPQLGTLSHIFGYMMEALVDLGEIELARKGLDQALRLQKADGSVPAYPGVEWVCSTGLAQLGIAWAKTGQREPAEKALHYLQKIQNPSGGFYGGYGKGAEYFPQEEISWANKFFIDLYLLVEKPRFA